MSARAEQLRAFLETREVVRHPPGVSGIPWGKPCEWRGGGCKQSAGIWRKDLDGRLIAVCIGHSKQRLR